MPTTAIATFGNSIVVPLKNPEGANPEVIRLAPSATYLAGTLVGEVTATPGVYGAYNVANTPAGTGLPTHILMYGGVTDASGNISFGAGPAGTSEWSQTSLGMPAWRSGYFNAADLVGLDANVITIKRAVLTQGTVSAGHVMFLGV